MSDPNQTANEVAKITQAWREHLAEEADKRPVTYHDASGGNIVDQMDRYRELAPARRPAGAYDPLAAVMTFMTRSSIAPAWGEFQEQRPLVVAPI